MTTTSQSEMLNRSELLLGRFAVEKIVAAKIIIFGVGGVGSWCAESLVRSGVRNLTIVDSDKVCVTNVNRQLMATSKTIGQVKVEAMKARLLEINPDAQITAIQDFYTDENSKKFHLETFDYVVDAIDSISDKAHLIINVTTIAKAIKSGEICGDGVSKKLTLISSMGSALRMDPTKVRVTEFWKVDNDALARALRKKFRQWEIFPAQKFQCVYSEEVATKNKTDINAIDDVANVAKVHTNGSLCHVTAVFGFTIAGIIIGDLQAD